MTEVVDLDAIEASGGFVDLDADPEFAQGPGDVERDEFAATGEMGRGIGKGIVNLVNMSKRLHPTGIGRHIPDVPMPAAFEPSHPDFAPANTMGRMLPGLVAGAAAPSTLLGNTASGAVAGAAESGDLQGTARGAAAGAALSGVGLVSKARELAAALKANPGLRKALMGVAEQLPLGIGGQVRQTRKFLGAANVVRKKIGGSGAAEKTVTGGEKAAALTSPKRIREAEFKAQVEDSRAGGTQLDEITPDLVREQGAMMAEKQINAALAKGDVRTARALLEKVNKQFGTKLNLADLAKKSQGKKP